MICTNDINKKSQLFPSFLNFRFNESKTAICIFVNTNILFSMSDPINLIGLLNIIC